VLIAVLLSVVNSACGAEPDVKGQSIEVDSVVLRLQAEAEVPAEEAGVLTAVPVREGQLVKAGELLAQIDDEVARMAERSARFGYEVARAKAANDVQIRFAKKAAEVAEAELRRSTDSIERFAKSVSQSQLDVEQLTVEKTRLEIEQASELLRIAALEMKAKQNELTAARADVARRRIEAPFDGIIVQVFVRLGEWVEPGQQALRIVDTSRLKAEGFLAAEVASADLRGAPVKLTVEGSNDETVFTGTVAFVSPEVDPITGQVRIWAEIDNRDGRLRPGQPVRMTIGAAESVARNQ
jgi:macrolide-specific efflux system membrane fusion protein